MEISEHQSGEALVLTCDGRLDYHGAETFRLVAEKHIADGCRFLIVDFQSINFLASMGIRAIVLPAQKMTQAGGRFCVIRLAESARGVFALAGLDKIFPIYDDEASAQAAVS